MIAQLNIMIKCEIFKMKSDETREGEGERAQEFIKILLINVDNIL